VKTALDVRVLLYYAFALLVAFGFMGTLLFALGYSPINGYATFFKTPFMNLRAIGLFLVKFTSLYLMGLAFAVPLQARKFNVGNEGQFLLGAIGAAVAGIYFGGLPSYVALPLGLIIACLLGMLWAAMPAFMLFLFNVNEIVSTILFNFISFYLVDYIALGSLRDVFAGHPMTIPVSDNARIPTIVPQTNINAGLVIAIIVGIAMYIVVSRTTYGYELRAAGSNPIASEKHGINVKLLAPLSLIMGGALAGLAGGIEVLGYHYRLIEGMHGFYSPLSIILTLMVKGNPLLLFLSTFFVTLVDVGSNALQRTMGVPVEISLILLGLLMLLIMIAEYLSERR
jgi:simple sugar transport system permease protein